MKDWFLNLTQRERMFVSGLGAVLVVTLVFLLLLQPLYAGTAKRATRVQQKQQDLAWMQDVAEQIKSGEAPGVASCTGQSLVIIVANTARDAGLANALRRSQPTGSDTIQVRFEGARVDSLFDWLGRLHVMCGVKINVATFDRGTGAGIVNAGFTLGRTG